MCGIIGIVGERDVAARLLQAYGDSAHWHSLLRENVRERLIQRAFEHAREQGQDLGATPDPELAALNAVAHSLRARRSVERQGRLVGKHEV